LTSNPAPPSNTYYHLDATGNFIEGKKIILNSTDSLESYYADTDAQGNDIFYAEVTGNTNAHILFKESNDQVVWAKSYHSSLANGILKKITAAIVGNNSYIMAGSVLTHNLSGNTGKDEYQNYLIKTDAYGNTNCSDTFSIPFNIVKADTVVQYPASWYEIQGMKSNPVKVDMQDLLPYEFKDCLLTNSCCTTPLHYVDTVLCNKAAYNLPDNTSVTLPGIYSNYFQTSKGCDSVIFTTLTQAGIPSIKLGADTCIVGSSNFILIPQTYNSAFKSFTWQDGSRDSSYKVNTPGLYWVKASSSCGTVSDSIMIYNNCNLPVYIPSAFTPNGDGLNDVFRIIDMGHQELLDFSIFNRFGQQIFKTNNPKQGWDGKINAMDQPASVFVYYIKYKDLLGRQQSINGTVTLIR
jgi:gliding motility-associated-like protein